MREPASSLAEVNLPRRLSDALPAVRQLVDLAPAAVGSSPEALSPLELSADLDVLEHWLTAETAVYSELDLKSRAAFMIGGIAWSMCAWLAALRIGGAEPVGAMSFRQEQYRWEYGELSGVALRYCPTIEAGTAAMDMRGFVEEQFAPLIAATMVLTGLSPGAQWRIVADSLARAFLYTGNALGAGPRARLEANTILAEGRLQNGKTRFVQVAEGSRCEWFVSRGGCCRNYMVPGEETCTTCVLRKPAEQIELVRKSLRG